MPPWPDAGRGWLLQQPDRPCALCRLVEGAPACPLPAPSAHLRCPSPPSSSPLQLKESQPGLSLGEVGKATGEAWKELSDKVGRSNSAAVS